MKKLIYLFMALLISQDLLAVVRTWTGAISTDWATTGNWSTNDVPTSSDNVIIPNVTNKPIITSSTTIRQIDIQTGRLLTIDSGVTLTINPASNAAVIVLSGTFLMLWEVLFLHKSSEIQMQQEPCLAPFQMMFWAEKIIE